MNACMAAQFKQGLSDTIAAIATARGRAALAIVRLSGAGAVACADQSVRGVQLQDMPSHTVHVGMWESASGEVLDQVVVTVFRAPASATGEDVVEVSCHGGDYVAARILSSMLEQGARMAEPGEFTLRAFVNGKLDLVQAEAVADLIHATSAAAHRLSLNHLQGRYSRALESLRQSLIDFCALAELEIDFSEEDVEFAGREELLALLERSDALLSEAVDSYSYGELIREGVRVVIAGRPNAGKSTLLNALLGQDRAIVSPEAGTTRDVVEADKEMEGLLFRFIDTAGLRGAVGRIEAEGVRRARRAMERATVVLYVYDLEVGLSTEESDEIDRLSERSEVIVVGNKLDLNPDVDTGLTGEQEAVFLSARKALDCPRLVRPLWERLAQVVVRDLDGAESRRVITNLRHVQHMERALCHVRSARLGVADGKPADLFTLDIRAALHELGCITGSVTNEEVLGRIFSRFCIGK